MDANAVESRESLKSKNSLKSLGKVNKHMKTDQVPQDDIDLLYQSGLSGHTMFKEAK